MKVLVKYSAVRKLISLHLVFFVVKIQRNRNFEFRSKLLTVFDVRSFRQIYVVYVLMKKYLYIGNLFYSNES